MGIKSVDSRVIAYKVLESVQLNLGCLKTLQLSQNQNSIEDINSSYRRLCLLLHPDKHNGDTVYLEAFKAVNLAHKEALTTMSQVKPHRLSDEQPTNPKPAAGHSKWTPFTHAMAPPQQQNHQQPPKATDASAVPTANKWADKSREVKARLLQESAVVNIQEGSSNAALVNKATNKKQSEKKSRFLTARGPSNRRKRKRRRATGMTTTTRAATEANGGGLVSTINSVRKNNNNNIYNNNILVPHSTIGTSSKWIKPISNLEYTNTTADVENIEEEEEDVMTEDSSGDYDSEIETDDNEEDSVSWDDNCTEEEDDDGGDGGGISSGVRKKKSKSDGDDEKKEAEAREEKMTVELFLRPPSFGSRGGDRQTRLGISTKKGLCSL